MAEGGVDKRPINSGVIAMENYGSMGNGNYDDETVDILQAEEMAEFGGSSENLMKKSPHSWDAFKDKKCFFRDGLRKIDYVLVFEDDFDTLEKKKEGKIGKKKDKTKMTLKDKHEMWRNKFMQNIQKAGLEVEEETVESEKKMTYYMKLHAPWEVLCYYAEDLCMRAPLQAHPNPSSNWSGKLLSAVKIPNLMEDEVPNKPLDFYTCQFRKSKINRFLGADQQETFFMTKDRIRIVYEVLVTATYGKRKRAEIGIDRLLEEEAYSAAYPLHDGDFEPPPSGTPTEAQNPRQVLYQYWARWGTWYKYQPLDHIRDYFGEKIGIYFAWLGFYTAWLLPAAIVGLLVFMYGVITMHQNPIAVETCDTIHDFKMCPLCDEDIGCQYWNLSSVCMYTKLAYLFDHPGTVFYAVFVSFWAVTFLEYWKRKNASLAHHWDCSEYEEEEERPRPEYAAMCPTMEKNPVTGVKEPYFPERDRTPRIISGIAVIIIMMVLVVIFIVAVILYRVLISIPLFQNPVLQSQASTIASISAAVVNLILIMSLGKVYEKLALKLTQWEMHRTQTEFDDNLIFKVFCFQFVNFYSSIIYIGFFKGKMVGYPGHYATMFGLRAEECQNGGCLIELAMQLAVIMIGKQAINNAQELFVPKIKTFIHKWKIGASGKHAHKTRWEEDYELIDSEGLFDEYLEMVLQFGFITIFVAAFPLAPLFALLNNWMEIRLDSHKFVCETRRPVAERAQDIGVWFTILEALAQLAVISNAFLIAFTSEFLPQLMYQYMNDGSLKGYVNFTLAWAPNGTLSEPCRYTGFRTPDGQLTMFFWHLLVIRLAFVIIFEHVVFGISRVIDILVPDVPESLELKMKRERYLAKQALADTDTVMMDIHGHSGYEDDEDQNQNAATLKVPGQV